jgi:predicted amidohydrolase
VRALQWSVIMTNETSRRTFLKVAAGGAALHAVESINAGPRAACEALSDATPGDTASNVLPSHTGICPQHAELVLRRSAAEHERVAKSLNAADSRAVTVAAGQLANHCDGAAGKQANLKRMLACIVTAAAKDVQVLVLPELCLPGYLLTGTSAEAAEINHSLADAPGSSPELDQLADAARRFQMVLAFGFCEQDGGDYYNSIGLIDADGTWLGTRKKNPLSPHPYETDSFREPDPAQRSAVFRTPYGMVGLSNCFDGEFPESIRRMRLAGAELLLWSNAGTGNPETGHSARINSAGCYAQSNRMWVVCCNAVGGNCYGTSVIVGPSGEPLVILPPGEEALGIATINLSLTGDWERWRSRLDPIWKDEVSSLE